MATNFNELESAIEKVYTSAMMDEVCQLYGIPTYYLKKTEVNLDRIFGEDDMQKYNDAVELYLLPDDPSQFDGTGDVFSAFGMTAIDTMTMYCEIERFKTVTGLDYPIEHDLVYIAIFDSWFEISFTDDEGGTDQNLFFWNGEVACFKIDLIKYRYSHETISTGVDAVDDNLPDSENQTITDNDTIDDYEKENSLMDEFDEMLEGVE